MPQGDGTLKDEYLTGTTFGAPQVATWRYKRTACGRRLLAGVRRGLLRFASGWTTRMRQPVPTSTTIGRANKSTDVGLSETYAETFSTARSPEDGVLHRRPVAELSRKRLDGNFQAVV